MYIISDEKHKQLLRDKIKRYSDFVGLVVRFSFCSGVANISHNAAISNTGAQSYLFHGGSFLFAILSFGLGAAAYLELKMFFSIFVEDSSRKRWWTLVIEAALFGIISLTWVSIGLLLKQLGHLS